MPNVSLKVEGLSKLEQIPGWLDEGQKRFIDTIGKRLADVTKEASPKSAIPFHAEAVNSTTIRVTSDHPGAHALDAGAFIKGKGKLLKFTVGGKLVFAKFVRLKARKYTKKALRKRNSIVTEEYQKIFNNIVK